MNAAAINVVMLQREGWSARMIRLTVTRDDANVTLPLVGGSLNVSLPFSSSKYIAAKPCDPVA